MNRDSAPDSASITLATVELLAVARRTWHTLSANYGLAIGPAVDAMTAALGQLWPSIPPESARDALCSAARAAVTGGITTVPMRDADFTASTLLEMTAEWLAANPGHEVTGAPVGFPANPPLVFASSCAFDRDEDAETLRSLAVLCVLAEMAARPQMYPATGTGRMKLPPVEFEVPETLTAETGLTSWPERGSESAPLAVMAWEHARRRVTMTYEQQDALWCVTEHDGARVVSIELFERAAHAYSAALDIIVSPLP